MYTRPTAIDHPAETGRGKVNSSSVKKITLTDEEIILREMKIYEQVKAELVKKYDGKYIAMLLGQVLDSDSDVATLAKRVYEKFGYKAIFMTLVTAHEKPYKISSPRFNLKKIV